MPPDALPLPRALRRVAARRLAAGRPAVVAPAADPLRPDSAARCPAALWLADVAAAIVDDWGGVYCLAALPAAAGKGGEGRSNPEHRHKAADSRAGLLL